MRTESSNRAVINSTALDLTLPKPLSFGTRPLQKVNFYSQICSPECEAALPTRKDLRILQPTRGDIYLAEIVFTDGSGSKVRPTLVLAKDGSDLIVAPLTRHAPRTGSDVELSAWAESGLSGPSTVRCSKIGPLSRDSFRRRIGRLPPEDLCRVSNAASRWFHAVVA
ncbi:MAG: type II toxin-antitoxin system PemK/MazF family toxin [Pedosphaera sp.]|nr:type II toxin-antitoxin system PemK/MazF family toxin [Pedosphaera sp.]